MKKSRKEKFLQEVRDELIQIRNKATKAEIKNLVFKRFDKESESRCIYGQMTGSCRSDRAAELMPKSYKNISGRIELNEQGYLPIDKQPLSRGSEFTALEKYLFDPNCNDGEIFKFLRGYRTEQQLNEIII